MDPLYIAVSSSILFFLFKFIDSKLISKEPKTIKSHVKDLFMVFCSSYLGIFLLTKLSEGGILGISKQNTPAFTDSPEF
jgi:hypothetical protein